MGSNSHGECAACCVEIGSFRNPLPGDGMRGIVLTNLLESSFNKLCPLRLLLRIRLVVLVGRRA